MKGRKMAETPDEQRHDPVIVTGVYTPIEPYPAIRFSPNEGMEFAWSQYDDALFHNVQGGGGGQGTLVGITDGIDSANAALDLIERFEGQNPEESSAFDGANIDFELEHEGKTIFVDWDSQERVWSFWWDTNDNDIPDAHLIVRGYDDIYGGGSRSYLDLDLDGTGDLPLDF